MMNGLVSVTYELEDTHCNGGGLCVSMPTCLRAKSASSDPVLFLRSCCIPGSHKSQVDVPFDRDLSKPLHASVEPMPLAAGDCLIFTGGFIPQLSPVHCGRVSTIHALRRAELFFCR